MGKENNYSIKADYKINPTPVTFDGVSGTAYWNEKNIYKSFYYQYYVYRLALRLILEKKINSMVDIGCGPANKLSQIQKKAPWVKIIGIDQEYPIRYNRKNYNFGIWLEDDLENPTSEINIYNPELIMLADVLEHLIDPDKVLSFVKSNLSRDGYAIISTPERDLLRGKGINYSPNKFHIREWNKSEFRNYLDASGFNIIKSELQLPVKIELNNIFYREVIGQYIRFRKFKYNQVYVIKVK